MNLPPRISQTQIGTWQRCHYQYYLKYVLGFKRNSGSLGLARGSLLHNAYDAYLFKGRVSHSDAYDQVDADSERMLNAGMDPEIINKAYVEARLVLDMYLPYADRHDKFDVVIIDTDQKTCEYSGFADLHLPDGSTKQLHYKIDMLIKPHSDPNELHMMEHKFRKRNDDPQLMYDQQSALYQAAWNSINPAYTISGLLYNIITVRESYEPAMRKDGKGYLKGGSPQEIADTNVLRYPFVRNVSELSTTLADAAATAQEIKSNFEGPNPVWPRNLNAECRWCEFAGPCLGIRAGSSIEEYVAMGEYSTAESRARSDSKTDTVATPASDSKPVDIRDLIDL